MILNNKYVFTFLMLVLLCFFGLLGFRSLADLKWLFYPVLIVRMVGYKCRKTLLFDKLLLVFLLCLFVNCYNSLVQNEETFLSYLDGECSIIFPVFFYYVFMRTRMRIENLEFVLMILCFAFCFAYLVQFVAYPRVFFQGAMAEGLDIELRFRLTGQCLGAIAFLMGINKIFIEFSTKYLCLAFCGLVVTLIVGFRSQIAALTIVTLIMFIRIKGIKITAYIKYVILGFLFMLVFVQIPIVKNKIQEMVERNENANFDNQDYIRIVTYDYYASEVKKQPYAYWTGLGLPGSHSKYQNKIDTLKHKNGIVWADWGIIGLSWMLGIPGVIIIILICIYTLYIKVPKQFYYISFSFLFLLLGSIMTREIYRVGAFFVQAYLLMLLNKIYLKYDRKK